MTLRRSAASPPPTNSACDQRDQLRAPLVPTSAIVSTNGFVDTIIVSPKPPPYLRQSAQPIQTVVARGLPYLAGWWEAVIVAMHDGGCVRLGVTPHVSQNTKGRRSAIDGRTTRHAGQAISLRIRKRIEVFGWIKTVGGLRKTRHRGTARVGWMFTFAAAAYNLVRIPKLLAGSA
jgi:hypothetical protein